MIILRKYQLDIVFLFLALLLFIGMIFYWLEQLGKDPHDFEWYIAGPLVFFYFIYIWQMRNKINIAQRRSLTTKSLIYWIVLGIILFIHFESPLAAKSYWSMTVLFLVFTLLLADSYWDFKKINLKSFLDKKEK